MGCTSSEIQVQIQSDPVYTQWPSNTGAQLLVVDGLLDALCDNRPNTPREVCDRFLTDALATLRKVRNAAVQARNSHVEEVCREEVALESDFKQLFAAI